MTWFGWTTNHLPLAGSFDWMSLLPVAVTAIALFAIGIEAFVRRDIGATTAIPSPRLPRALVGLHGPTGRTFGNNLPVAVSWGLGLGVFGLLIAGSAGSFVEQLGKSGEFMHLLGSIFPGIDFATVGGVPYGGTWRYYPRSRVLEITESRVPAQGAPCLYSLTVARCGRYAGGHGGTIKMKRKGR